MGISSAYLAFDADPNGSGQQSIDCRLREQGVNVRRVSLPDGHDPNSFFVEEGDARQFQSLCWRLWCEGAAPVRGICCCRHSRSFWELANLAGGFSSDALVRRLGLERGRRNIAMCGLGASALFTVATILTPNKYVALVFLALSYAGSDFMLPTSWAVCLDIGKKYAGAVTGAMNTAGQIGSFLSSVVFGYLVKYSGSYEVPLVPMAVMLTVSAALWMKIDATKALIPEGVDAKKLAA